MAILIDAYTWRATYHDDTQVPEFDEATGRKRGIAEVDSAQAKMLELIDLAQKTVHRVSVPSGAEPVFVRRRRTAVNLVSSAETYLGTAHCIGWKQGKSGCYLFIFGDGSTLLTSDFQAV